MSILKQNTVPSSLVKHEEGHSTLSHRNFLGSERSSVTCKLTESICEEFSAKIQTGPQ